MYNEVLFPITEVNGFFLKIQLKKTTLSLQLQQLHRKSKVVSLILILTWKLKFITLPN